MLYWFPKIKNLGIPTPKTEIVVLKKWHDELIPICDGDFSPIEPQWEQILVAARKIGFPLFMRTDEFSGKHNWKNTCYVEKEEDLKQHIGDLFENSFTADFLGLPIRALVFREYIPMKNLFKAFHGEMPVNPEIRCFIKDGKFLCWHWYWIEDAIINPSASDWKEIMREEQKHILCNETVKLIDNALIVAKQFEGYWSVDFCKAKDGRWILIDMAEGEKSWHPECKAKDGQT
jgi:hypothetical protein